MGQLTGSDDVGKAVTIDICDGDIFGGAGFRALGQGDQLPLVRVSRAKGNADMAFGCPVIDIIGFVNGDDVHVSVTVQVSHLQAITATQFDATDGLVIDQVLTPGDKAIIGGAYHRGYITDAATIKGLGTGKRAGESAGKSTDKKEGKEKTGPGIHGLFLWLFRPIQIAGNRCGCWPDP